MKKFLICTAALLFAAGVFSVNAQDLIVLKDGTMIEAKVLEISPTEIRYKRFDHLDGPTIVIFAADILSIKYENGIVEVINAVPSEPDPPVSPVPSVGQRTAPAVKTPALDPNKLYFGIYAEPSGFALYGPSLSAEWTKGMFNAQLNMRLGVLGLFKDSDFGAGLAVNYFAPSWLGGFYVGGMLEYSFGMRQSLIPGHYNGYWHYGGYWGDDGYWVDDNHWIEDTTDWVEARTEDVPVHNFGIALSIGYKFILSSRLYFRTSVYAGYTFSTYEENSGYLIRPEVTLGYFF